MMVSFKTKNAAAYEALRRDIIEGGLRPGQKINMSEIAKDLGLSESPVREAIRKLESEGYVQFTPHVGAVISKMNLGRATKRKKTLAVGEPTETLQG